MTGEETGLHAFDDLDPVSTVSALSTMPEPELEEIPVAAKRAPMRTTPPEGRLRAPAAKPIGLPPPRAASASLPPPAASAPAQARISAPPPPPAAAVVTREADNSGITVLSDDDALLDEEAEIDEDTRIVPNAFAHDPDFAPTAAFARPSAGEEFEAFEDANAEPDDAPTQAHVGPAGVGINDNELLELSATTVATNIDMDWDEEELETTLRDGAHASDLTPPAPLALPQIGGRPSPFPPPALGSYAGNPSPFGAARTSFPPPSNDQAPWEDEEDARTKIHSVPAAGPEGAVASLRQNWLQLASTLVGADRPLASNRLAWVGFGGVVLLAFCVAAYAWMGGREPGTITLVTKPADAQVVVDGKVLTGQTSPFTAQGMKPGEDHVLEVRRDGYATESRHFSLKSGEVKPLDTIELAAQRVDTGFALTSLPAGATVSIDGRRIDQLTPVRIADLSSGLHVVRLDYGTAYQPWETQVALATGQVIELPTARLVPAAPSAPVLIGSSDSNEQSRSSGNSSSGSSDSAHRHHAEHATMASAPAPRMRAPMIAAPLAAAPGPMYGGGGGSQGSLRVNSRPWSQVFVDGRMVGNTPQMSLSLPAGHHSVKLVNPQLGMSKSFGIDVRTGKVVTKIVDLE